MLQKILSVTVLFFLTSYTLAEPFAYGTAQEGPGTPEISYEEALKRLDEFMEKIKELRSHIDRSQFDLEALLDKIGYEAEDIIRFVKEEIAFEQYPGLLRGAQGTLMSRAGNALDQSVLLATLLKDAGYEARIQRGRISLADAGRLLAQMNAPRDAQPVLGDLDSITEILRQLGKEAQRFDPIEAALRMEATLNAPDPSDQVLSETLQEQTDLILELLAEKGISLGDPQKSLELTEEARDYFWVEYKVLAADPWRATHPALGNAQAPGPQIVATFSSEIPEQLQHRVRFQAFIGQQSGTSQRRQPLMRAWERPAANLHGRTITFGTAPSRLTSSEDLTRLPEILAESSLFLPFFEGRLPDGANGFDRYGNTFPPDALALGGAGELIATVGGRAQAAASALMGIGRPDEGKRTAAQMIGAYWLEYTLIAPGGSETLIRRDILQPISRKDATNDGTSQEVWSQLLTGSTFSVATGGVPNAYLVDRVAKRLLDSRALYQTILRVLADESETEAWPRGELRMPQPVHLLQLFAIFDALTGENGPYRAAPSILSHRAGLLSPDSTYELIDVVNSSRRSLRHGPHEAREAALELLRQGVWETLTEGVVLSNQECFQTSISSTFSALERARAQGATLKLLVPSEPINPSDDLAGPSVERELARDLDAGFVLVIPQWLAEGDPLGWWRVNPSTGETLGMLHTAGGANVLQYITLIGIGLGIVLAGISILDCLKMQSVAGRGAAMCCWMNALAGFGSGIVTGTAVAFVGGAIAKNFVIGALIGLYFNDIVWGFVALGKGWPQICDPMANN